MLRLLWAHREMHRDAFLGVLPKLLSRLTKKRQYIHPMRWGCVGTEGGRSPGSPKLGGKRWGQETLETHLPRSRPS